MTQACPSNVYTAMDVARLERIVAALPSGECVRLHLADGRTIVGQVSDAPVLQLCETPGGGPGSNALLRLERCRSAEVDGVLDLWIDGIVEVMRLTTEEFERGGLPWDETAA